MEDCAARRRWDEEARTSRRGWIVEAQDEMRAVLL